MGTVEDVALISAIAERAIGVLSMETKPEVESASSEGMG